MDISERARELFEIIEPDKPIPFLINYEYDYQEQFSELATHVQKQIDEAYKKGLKDGKQAN